MLLVIMLSFYFCEICGNFPQTVTNHTCPLYTGTQWSTISATRIIRCQVSFISSTHTPILTSPSFKCWGGGSGGSPESEAAELHEARVGAPVQVLHLLAGLLINKLWMVWDWEGGTKQKIFVIFDVVYIDWFALHSFTSLARDRTCCCFSRNSLADTRRQSKVLLFLSLSLAIFNSSIVWLDV